MEFQTLKNRKNKKIIIGIIAFITIISIVFIGRSYANYRTIQSVNIANGKINYKVPDLRIVAVKLQSESNSETYNDGNTIPTSGYTLNTSKSICGQSDGNGYATKDDNIDIKYYSNGKLLISNLKKNTRCYLYFDISGEKTISDIISNHNLDVRKVINKPLTTDTSGTLFVDKDDWGLTYYYAGAVNNNWIKFGTYKNDVYFGYDTSYPNGTAYYKQYTSENECKNATSFNEICEIGITANTEMYWRIIRINGDGSMRLIYTGTTAPGNDTQYVMKGNYTKIATSKYNNLGNDNAYVGYMYGTTESTNYEDTHINTHDSDIKIEIDKWFANNLLDFKDYISYEAGFCNDRALANGKGYNQEPTDYAPLRRAYYGGIKTNQEATYNCTNQENDLFTTSQSSKGNKKLTYPAGLITSDEILFAGGYLGTKNTSYYLNNGLYNWSMSPWYNSTSVCNGACVFTTWGEGNLEGGLNTNTVLAVRPVINLKEDTIFTGSGTYDDVYKVVGTND